MTTSCQYTHRINGDNWSCPHGATDEHDYCVFHRPPDEVNQTRVRERLLDAVETADTKTNQFIGARFGTLSLDNRVIDSDGNHPIDFRDATFERRVSALNAIVDQPIRLTGATFESDLQFRGAQLRGALHLDEAAFEGDASFDAATFERRVDASGSTFLGDASFEDTRFRGRTFFTETIFSTSVSFVLATFEQGASFREAIFRGVVSFREATFGSKATFEAAIIEAAVSFEATTFRAAAGFDAVDLRRLRIDGAVTLDGVEAHGGGINFHGTTFDSASIYNATIDGRFILGETTVNNGLDFAETTVEGRLSLMDATVGGNMDLEKSTLSGALDAAGAEFDDSLMIDGVECEQFVFDDAVVVGEVTLSDVRFLEDASFAGTQFQNTVRIERCRFLDSTRFNTTLFTHGATIVDTHFLDTVIFDNVAISEGDAAINIQDTRLAGGRIQQSGPEVVVFQLAGSKLGEIRVDGPAEARLFDWFRLFRCDFDGFDFGAHRSALSAADWKLHTIPTAAVAKESWPRDRLSELEALENTYLKGKNGAKQVSDAKATAEFFRLEMQYRRKIHRYQLWYGRGTGRLRAFKRFFSNLAMGLTTGYGERPSRVIGTTVAIVGMFAAAYWAFFNTTFSPNADAEALLFSFQSFIAFLVGSPAEGMSFWLRFTSVIEGFIGAFFVALFVFTLTRSVHR